jgi:type IX secretion system PorP/SprF family membrane protein
LKHFYKGISLLTLVAGLNATAQDDLHFSQFYNALPILNPANSGIFYGNVRANMHYRSQWTQTGTPFTTMAGSIDLPVLDEITGNDMIAAGVYGIKDEYGITKNAVTGGGLNLAFGKSFDPDERHFWSLGAKAAFTQLSIDYSGARWGSMWSITDNDWDTKLPGELIGTASKTYTDFGAGFNYFFSDHQFIRSMWGISMNHINKPKVEFQGDEYQLSRSVFVHGEVDIFSHSGKFSIVPRTAAFVQGRSRYFILGSSFDFLLKQAGKHVGEVKETSLEFGLHYRWRDAVIAHTQFNYGGLSFGASFDITVSKLSKAVQSSGGFEVYLHYKAGFKKGVHEKHTNDRFDSIH